MFEQTFENIDDVLWKEAGCFPIGVDGNAVPANAARKQIPSFTTKSRSTSLGRNGHEARKNLTQEISTCQSDHVAALKSEG